MVCSIQTIKEREGKHIILSLHINSKINGNYISNRRYSGTTCPDLFGENQVWITALDFREQEREAGSCDTAAKENYKKHQDAKDVMKTDMGHLLHKTTGVPTFSESALKASAEIMAPAFPDAAEIP